MFYPIVTCFLAFWLGWLLSRCAQRMERNHKYRQAYLLPWYKILYRQLLGYLKPRRNQLPF